MINKIVLSFICCLLWIFSNGQYSSSLEKKEAEYYKIVDVPIPNDIKLEVGGLAFSNKDQLGISTRRGEVWLIDNPYGKNPIYTKYASGLHEPLGLAFKNNSFYLSQRGELTRLEDKNGDNKADVYNTIYSWPLSGNYHEYSYGPKFMPNGDMLVTLNLSWVGRGASLAKWRGWLLKISPEGEMTPMATGLRSPAGFELNSAGDIFYTENQGDWVGSGRMTHLELGDFAGNTGGLKWTNDPQSPLTLKPEDIEEEPNLSLFEYAKKVPELKIPAIWFPHTMLGISTSDILYDTTKGKFGPFDGQIFIGDQGHSKVMRVFMEKVNGVYQGATFNFKEGFSSGVLRMIWGSDNSMFVGMTSRGWNSTGDKMFGLQRLKWTGKIPFEIKSMKALKDGFLLEFTKPVNQTLAANPSSYEMGTFTYLYHLTYGSDIVDRQKCIIESVAVSKDGLNVKLKVHGMRLGLIHSIDIPKLKSASGDLLLHPTGYYTLNEVPGGILKSPSVIAIQKTNTKVKQTKRTIKMPEKWINGATKELEIGTLPGLKFDVTEVKVKQGDRIKLTFNNIDDMMHNLVITEKGKASVDKVGQLSMKLGVDGPALNFVPETELVLYHTGILSPETSETIYFEIPKNPGTYWIVCTFPGHAQVMRAKLIVE